MTHDLDPETQIRLQKFNVSFVHLPPSYLSQASRPELAAQANGLHGCLGEESGHK